MSNRRPSLVLLTVPVLFLGIACGNENGDEIIDLADLATPTIVSQSASDEENAAVERTIRSVFDAYNVGDLNTFLRGWTEQGIQEAYGVGTAELTAQASDFFDGPERQLRKVSKTSVRAGSAYTEVEYSAGDVLSRESLILENAGDGWKISAVDSAKPEIKDAEMVNVKATDNACVYDPSRIEDGFIAFHIENDGTSDAALTLFRVPEGLNFEQVSTGALPSGIEFVGSTGSLEAGEDGWLAFVEPLESGRYATACQIAAEAAAQPAKPALTGTVLEFTIGGLGGGR